MVIQDINLNLIPTGTPIVVHVNQNDRGSYRLRIFLKLNGERYIWTNGSTFKLRGTKPNGETFEKSCGYIGVEYLQVNLDTDIDGVSGDVYCNVEMTEGDDRTGTQAFILRVQKEAK